MNFSIIVAHDKNRGIGEGNQIPWHLPGDIEHFKNMTRGASSDYNAVIMGRKSWLSLPIKYRPLPQRYNIILSKTQIFSGSASSSASSFDQALHLAERASVDKIWVIGGEQIYKLAINHPKCEKIYVTEIHGAYKCDTFFPPYTISSGGKFEREWESSDIQVDAEEGTTYRFSIYKNIADFGRDINARTRQIYSASD